MIKCTGLPFKRMLDNISIGNNIRYVILHQATQFEEITRWAS